MIKVLIKIHRRAVTMCAPAYALGADLTLPIIAFSTASVLQLINRKER